MINAEMQNKIKTLVNWEDILTSNVFGLWELIDYKHLLGFISMAKNYKGDGIENKFKNKKIQTVEFWKYFKNIGEPDILVKLNDETLNDENFFVIEVKYFSHEHNKKNKETESNNKEGYKEDGQLSKYLNIKIDAKPSNFIIYLTADYQSIKKIQDSESSSKACLNNIYHIHWDQLNEYLQKIKDFEGIEKNIVNKIIEYLDYKGFEYWKGFSYNKAYDIQIITRGFYGNK